MRINLRDLIPHLHLFVDGEVYHTDYLYNYEQKITFESYIFGGQVIQPSLSYLSQRLLYNKTQHEIIEKKEYKEN